MILQQLREQTRAHHERVESAVRVMDERFDREAYIWLLARFWGFYRPAEQRLRSVLEETTLPLDLDSRWKTPLLERDLRALGEGAMLDTELLPMCLAFPPVQRVAEALGCMYVLEGATLGGQIILRHLRRTLGVEPESGAAFFGSYGAEVGPMWKCFGDVLATYSAAHPADNASMVAAARDTFDALDRWLHPLAP